MVVICKVFQNMKTVSTDFCLRKEWPGNITKAFLLVYGHKFNIVKFTCVDCEIKGIMFEPRKVSG